MAINFNNNVPLPPVGLIQENTARASTFEEKVSLYKEKLDQEKAIPVHDSVPILEKNVISNPKKNDIPGRLEKNRQIAKQQQDNEKAKGFVIKSWVTTKRDRASNKKPIRGETQKIDQRLIGIASCEGRRESMEDADIATQIVIRVKEQNYSLDLFGIFDGHGGSKVSAFVKQNITQYLKQALESNNQQTLTEEGIFKALKECFQKLDADYDEMEGGTTATIAIVLEGKIWVANVGDSRTIFVKDGVATQASEDAKPTIERYKKKIIQLGGFIFQGSILGHLSVARAIGDKYLTTPENNIRFVSPNPKITNYSLEDFKGGYLVLACDGLYDAATSNEVGQAIEEMAHKGLTLEDMARYLVFEAIRKASNDNVSVMIVKL